MVMATITCIPNSNQIRRCLTWLKKSVVHKESILCALPRVGQVIMIQHGKKDMQNSVTKISTFHTVQKCPNTEPAIPGGLDNNLHMVCLKQRWTPRMKINIISRSKVQDGIFSNYHFRKFPMLK